jgi:hypothetical protein
LEGNFKMDFKEIRWEGVNGIHLAQDRGQWQTLLNAVMNLWVPKYSMVTFYVMMRS